MNAQQPSVVMPWCPDCFRQAFPQEQPYGFASVRREPCVYCAMPTFRRFLTPDTQETAQAVDSKTEVSS